LRGLARGSKAVMKKKEASQRLRITETDLFNTKTREECRSVIIIARRLYRKWRVMSILQMIVNDTMTESECITMTKSGDYVTVTESGKKRV